MPTKPGWFFRGVFSSLVGGVLFSALSVLAGAVATWARGLTDLERGAWYGAAGLFLIVASAFWAARYFLARRWQGKEEFATAGKHLAPDVAGAHIAAQENEAAAALPEPIVPAASVNRLREAYEPCRRAMEFARVTLEELRFPYDTGRFDEWSALAARLVKSKVILAADESLRAMKNKISIKGDLSGSQFANLLAAFAGVAGQYSELLQCLLWVGRLDAGGEEQFEARSSYEELCLRHKKAMEALREASVRDDLENMGPICNQIERLWPPRRAERQAPK
jgi:hypothetical protein